jgi:hypothetical protein
MRVNGTYGRFVFPAMAMTNDMYGKFVIYVRKRHLWCDVPEPRGTQCHHAPAPVRSTRLKKNVIYARDVMYGRPPLGKGFFRRFGKRIRCGHVSGLYARCMDRWP